MECILRFRYFECLIIFKYYECIKNRLNAESVHYFFLITDNHLISSKQVSFEVKTLYSIVHVLYKKHIYLSNCKTHAKCDKSMGHRLPFKWNDPIINYIVQGYKMHRRQSC